MREFIYFSQNARTSGNFNDLMAAGRMDIACHVVIAAFFLSHSLREDVKLHLIFNGPPDAPKHLEFVYNPEIPISKKDVSGLIKRMLFKYKKGRKIEAFPGCFIEKKSFRQLLEEFEDRDIYILDKKGEDIRTAELGENPVFIVGDHEGIPKQEMKTIRGMEIKKISLGPLTYFASQTVVIVNHELDRALHINMNKL
ncbi:hypothetical protein HZA33_04100 [Candidatus Pacearchaeota archaeon]|nr:hypothetical protein [Candidatus Pacearchaeota archaeon]